MRKKTLQALIPTNKLRLLSVFVQEPSKPYRLADVADRLTVTPSTLQRPMQLFKEVGIFSSKSVGNNVFYQLNPQCEMYEDIISFVSKWQTSENKLQSLFRGSKAKVKVAFVYGEFVSSPEKFSEIQVFAIGSIQPRDCLQNLAELEERYGVDISPEFYSEKQIKTLLTKNKNYFRSAVESEKIFIAGGEKDLKGYGFCQ